MAENVYISVRQIYPGQYVPNFITIGQVSVEYISTNVLVCFFGSQCMSGSLINNKRRMTFNGHSRSSSIELIDGPDIA